VVDTDKPKENDDKINSILLQPTENLPEPEHTGIQRQTLISDLTQSVTSQAQLD